MQRDNFLVTYELDGGQMQNVVKHTWNAANKEVINIVRQVARTQDQLYENTQADQTKGPDGRHKHGTRTWCDRATGQEIFFTIRKVDNEIQSDI